MKRIALVALLLLAGVGGLCTAWYVSSQRALDAEVRVLEQRASQTAVEKEREVAEDLSRRLEELRRTESQRPYFQYQNLYHDPKGASEGLSVVPSPLASGPGNPLIAAHFQIDARGQVTLPTLNEELRELNAPDAAAQIRIRDALTPAAADIRTAASTLITTLEKEGATAARIAALEARLAARDLPPPPADPKYVEPARKIAVKQEAIDSSAFQQNINSNELFRELKSNRQAPRIQTPAVSVARALPIATPVQIQSTDLQWQTVRIGGRPRLAALRAVITPAGTLVQGLLTPALEGMTLARGGTPLEGTGWRVHLDPVETAASLRLQHMRDRTRFQRTFVAVCAMLLAVVAAVVWVLSRVEKLATDRARFAATAAHELRTPLASLRLYSDLIAEEDDPHSRQRYAREIAGQTERLGRVVANVLEVTRFERGTFALKPRPGAIGALVEECVARLRPQMEAAQCRIDLDVAGDLPQISFDPDALHHVVDNLVDNAEKFSREVPDRSIDVAVAAEEGGVAITVSDRGPGVPEDLLRDPRPYRRATSSSSPAGLGLGLFLVHRIVRGHGGVLRSVPRPGGGASVQVFLPVLYKS